MPRNTRIVAGAVVLTAASVLARTPSAQTPPTHARPAQTPPAAQGAHADTGSFRVDPVIVIDSARATHESIVAIKQDTLQIEILRGRAAAAYGPDADGGVIRFSGTNGSATAAARGAPPSEADGMSGMGATGIFGGMGGMRNPGGMPGMPRGMGGMAGMPDQSSPPVSASMSAGGDESAIYPIVIIKGSRITDDSLYKLSSKMRATIEFMEPQAATAAYGNAASAGAVIITPVPEPSSKAKKAKKKQ